MDLKDIPIIEELPDGTYYVKKMEINIPSKYAKLGIDVQDGDICVIRSEGALEPSPSDPMKKIYNFMIELVDGTKKMASFNNGTLKNLVKAYGKESKKWVGKPILANKVKMQVFNETKDVLVWSAPDDATEDEELELE